MRTLLVPPVLVVRHAQRAAHLRFEVQRAPPSYDPPEVAAMELSLDVLTHAAVVSGCLGEEVVPSHADVHVLR
jgi:hypothetical protein